jgi:hypothetical protein
METRSGEEPVFAAGPKLQMDFGDLAAWLKAKPGKRTVRGGGPPFRGHHALDTRPV